MKTLTKHSIIRALSLMIPILALYSFNEQAHADQKQHGIAMHGTLKYEANFSHFAYTNPKAPKGGTLNLGVQGSFSSLNPLNIRGGSAAGIRGYLYESLLTRALDEPFSLYGLIAEAIEVPDDRSFITFYLNKKAQFSDQKPITADDVIFSHELLKNHGRPNHRTYYSKVIKVERLNDHAVKFTFDESGDQEMPLIMGLMPIIPKHAMTVDLFKETSLKTPIGSGPYIIENLDPGKQITYTKNKNYWAQDLPSTKGRYNFSKITFTYYRDQNTLFEAFKKGLHDIQYEGNPGKWSRSYDFNAIKQKKVVKKEFPLKVPSGMSALVFNTRQPKFRDQRVRKALIYAFNFEGINRKLYHNLYSRTQSYFDRSYLSFKGQAADATEAKILGDAFAKAYPKIFDGSHRLPKNRGKELDRRNKRRALKLFKEAGFSLKDGNLVQEATGEPFKFEILIANKTQEALLLNYTESLRKELGITVNIRLVDSNAYQERKTKFDYEMFQNTWSGSLSPGNEQLFRWSVKQADTHGSFNFAGVKDPRIDKAIKALLSAKDPKTFTSSVRSLDRLLVSGDYVLPLYHLKAQWLAHWAYLGHPETVSFYGATLDSWWDKRSAN